MYRPPVLDDAEAGGSDDQSLLLLDDIVHGSSDSPQEQPLRPLRARHTLPRPGSTGGNLTQLLSAKYAERLQMERAPPPSLHALAQLCPLLAKCLSLSGLAHDAPHPRLACLSRPVRAGSVLLLSLVPLLPGAILPECSMTATASSACVSRSTSWLYVVIDAAFTAFLLAAGPPLVATLTDVLEDASAVSKEEVSTFARRTTRASLLLFVCLWALLPLVGLLQAATHAAGVGDVVTRWLWLIAGPARATLMTAVTTAVVVTLRLHTLPLKAIRAAARLREQDGERRTVGTLVQYYAALLSAYAHSIALLNSTSVRLQRLVAVLLLFGLQNIFSMLVFYLGTGSIAPFAAGAPLSGGADSPPAPPSSFAQNMARQYDVLEELVHCGAFIFMALAALGTAAHLTSLCDATGRALRGGLGHGLAAVLAGANSALAASDAPATSADDAIGAQERVPADVANEAALLSSLVTAAAESGGFRIVGTRVTFAWFSVMLTLALGVANFGLSTARTTGAGAPAFAG